MGPIGVYAVAAAGWPGNHAVPKPPRRPKRATCPRAEPSEDRPDPGRNVICCTRSRGAGIAVIVAPSTAVALRLRLPAKPRPGGVAANSHRQQAARPPRPRRPDYADRPGRSSEGRTKTQRGKDKDKANTKRQMHKKNNKCQKVHNPALGLEPAALLPLNHGAQLSPTGIEPASLCLIAAPRTAQGTSAR